MSFERKNPLPPGRYWLTVVGVEKIKAFSGLLNAATVLGVVVTENIELNGTSIDLEAVLQAILGETGEPRAWYLFRVTGIGTFSIDQKTFGFANIATDNIHNQDDTVQKPDPVGDAQDTVRTLIAVAEGLTVVIALKSVLDFLSKMRRK